MKLDDYKEQIWGVFEDLDSDSDRVRVLAVMMRAAFKAGHRVGEAKGLSGGS